ncbi:hypothetical protein VNO78_24654 [Psophocarpus tetragonolobus]|uniref:Uncharacterized protein n=1 Tax=Psophocarpus tetragonolobus TaxID=3891 RepID=A0AAN9S4T7_PSOTE
MVWGVRRNSDREKQKRERRRKQRENEKIGVERRREGVQENRGEGSRTLANRLRHPWRSSSSPSRNLSGDLELPLLDFPAAGNGSGAGEKPSGVGVR